MQVCTVVGARPQFVKAAIVSRALAEAGLREALVHTGQHYDEALDGIFFEELGLPRPVLNLEVGSGSHAAQTGAMLTGLEAYLQDHRPDWLLVYGDTNSTLAAALVAAKLHVPVAHVEAGLRSFNRRMPEEVNRIVTDRLARLCFCPTATAVAHLAEEGITEGVLLTGDVMLDATRHFAGRAAEHAPLASLTPHPRGTYALATVHRAENTDHLDRLQGIFDGLGTLAWPVLLPLHPRTRARLSHVTVPPNVQLMPPVGYLAMLTLLQGAARVLTDSGGLQKEAFWLGVPCVTLRDETEWVETLHGGWNRLAGADARSIAEAAAAAPWEARAPLGEGPAPGASACIARALQQHPR